MRTTHQDGSPIMRGSPGPGLGLPSNWDELARRVKKGWQGRWAAFREFDLPVLKLEMRRRLRGPRAFAMLFAYVLAISAIPGIATWLSLPRITGATMHSSGAGPSQDAAVIGQALFAFISLAQLAAILLIVPAFGASSVSSEREKRSFDLLAISHIASRSVITQKIAGAVAESILLLISSVPIVGTVLMFGGVSPAQIALVYLLLLTTALMLSSMAALFSTLLKTARAAVFASYTGTGLYAIGIPVGWIWLQQTSASGSSAAMEANPFEFVVMFALVGGAIALAIYGALAALLRKRVSWWQTRAFRMAIFGATYALLLMTMASRDVMGSANPAGSGLPLALYMSPAAAISAAVGGTRTLPDILPSFDHPEVVVIATLCSQAMFAFIMGRIATFRFEAIRNGKED